MSYRTALYPFTILLAGCALSACVSMKLPTTAQSPFKKQSFAQRRQSLKQITQWNIDGAFSFQQKGRAAIAAYKWKQNENRYLLQVHSSLDIYSVKITGSPGHVTLWQSDHKHFTAQSPERLMQKRLGWSLPISNLNYWIRGLPAPLKYTAKFDAYGHITQLQQDAWHITFSNYITVNNVDLPRTLRISSPNLKMKIVVKHWQLS